MPDYWASSSLLGWVVCLTYRRNPPTGFSFLSFLRVYFFSKAFLEISLPKGGRYFSVFFPGGENAFVNITTKNGFSAVLSKDIFFRSGYLNRPAKQKSLANLVSSM